MGGGARCLFRLHLWSALTAYIISESAMRRWTAGETALRFNDSYALGHIDFLLAHHFDTGSNFVTSRPMCAFQRTHKSMITQANATPWKQRVEYCKSQPELVHSEFEPSVFGNEGDPVCARRWAAKNGTPTERRHVGMDERPTRLYAHACRTACTSLCRRGSPT